MQTAHDQVRSLIDEIRHICNAHGIKTRRLEEVSDSIETITKAYMVSEERCNWDELRLTKTERRIAELLHKNMGRATTPDALWDAIYFDDPNNGEHITNPTKLVQVFICKMRKSFERHKSIFAIETAQGVGYRMVRKPAPDAVYSALAALRAN